MGSTNSTVSSSPFSKLLQVKRDRAKSVEYIKGQASEFYFLCSNGEVDQVRRILDAEDSPSIDVLNQLQPNGSTALHAATFNNRLDIVQLLFERGCPRIELNRYGNTAYDEASTNEMKRLFHRQDSANRFHETDAANSMSLYLPEENMENMDISDINEYVRVFKSESEILEYSLNKQTTAMWLKFYNWFAHTFRTLVETDNVHVDSFDLNNHPDFKQFLNRTLSEENLQKTLKAIDDARQLNSIEPLITLYTSEAAGFYHPLNRYLARSSSDDGITPHLCDRFVMEFLIHRLELKHRAFTGTTYRGATVPIRHMSIYQQAMLSDPSGVLGLKAFTSTSRDPLVVLNFAFSGTPNEDHIRVLFVFEIAEVSSTIFGIDDISTYGHEQEVLILPGNLFTVTDIQKQLNPAITKVYLRHWHTPVSFWKKIRQTIRSGQKSVL